MDGLAHALFAVAVELFLPSYEKPFRPLHISSTIQALFKQRSEIPYSQGNTRKRWHTCTVHMWNETKRRPSREPLPPALEESHGRVQKKGKAKP